MNRSFIINGLFLTMAVLSGALLEGAYILYKSQNTSEQISNDSSIEEIKFLKDANFTLTSQLNSLQKDNANLSKKLDKLNKELESLKTITPPSDKDIKSLINTSSYNVTGIHPKQLRSVISVVLKYLGEKDIKWIDLLAITSQVESESGKYIKQCKGPAVGIFQIEPATEKEVWKYFISKNKNLNDKITKLRVQATISKNELEYNLAYSVAIAYSIYKWRKVDPEKMSVADLIKAHKIKFNTMSGATVVKESYKKVCSTGIL